MERIELIRRVGVGILLGEILVLALGFWLWGQIGLSHQEQNKHLARAAEAILTFHDPQRLGISVGQPRVKREIGKTTIPLALLGDGRGLAFQLGHRFVHVRADGDSLHVNAFEGDWLR